MNAKEAQRISSEKRNIGEVVMGIDSVIRAEAKGYLAAIEGPEVKALEQAVDRLVERLIAVDNRNSRMSINKGRAALAQYREARNDLK